jgi:hypothetical protein
MLTSLDLGGLGRLSDGALHKLLSRTKRLTSLDLRGCSRLTEEGLAAALAGCDCAGAPTPGPPTLAELGSLTLCSVEAATDRVVGLVAKARPKLRIAR